MLFKSIPQSALFCALLISSQMFGQASKDKLAQTLADEFCVAFDKIKMPEKMDEAAATELGMLMIPIITKHKAEIKKEYGLGVESQEDFTKIGEIIGQKAAFSCPKFQKFSMQMVQNGSVGIDENGATTINETKAQTVSATFLGLETSGQFTCLKVKGADGRELKIWWMGYFEGSEDLSDGGASLKNKKVSIDYTEEEVYSATLKDYVKTKMMVRLKKE